MQYHHTFALYGTYLYTYHGHVPSYSTDRVPKVGCVL